MRSIDSRYFSVLAAFLGVLASILALAAAPWGVVGIGIVAFVASGAGLVRGEGAGALLGSGLVVAALLGPATVIGAVIAAAVVFTLTRPGQHHPHA